MINLLPDYVANQIAAGEVVQRPASVVKELVENAVDAGATKISLIIKDAGRTLIQIVDNGSGMSDRDARMAFERHATSKIKEIDDLQNLNTFGFRGEALASVAAVAEVELKTKLQSEELGTRILISASKIISNEPVQCSTGSSFSIKNLFYNIPARRKFLKSDASELKHIINEFQRVSICNSDIEFHFHNNGMELYNLPAGNLKQRLAGIFGKQTGTSLIDVGVETSMVKIHGYIGKPDKAKKSLGEQFFFVNNRFFRSPYFQKAVFKAYEQLLPPNTYPSFFLFFEIDPAAIDVNIHPQKTEIKFENEQAIWQMINAVVRESLSKYAIAPSIIFDMEGAPEIPVLNKNIGVSPPEIRVDKEYNPFKTRIDGWEQIYNFQAEGFTQPVAQIEPQQEQKTIFEEEKSTKRFLQIKGKYIITPVKSGVMLVDIRRAHQRILFEEFMLLFENKRNFESQQLLFPEIVDLSPSDYMLVQTIWTELENIGFDIRSFETNSVVFCAFPAALEKANAKLLIEEIIKNIKDDYNSPTLNIKEKISLSLAKAESLKRSTLEDEEMENLINKLFACSKPDIDAEGKPTISIITIDDMDKYLLK